MNYTKQIVMTRLTPSDVIRLDNNQIFVFGSNLSGRHGKGAAYRAYKYFGAKWGQAEGVQGKSYGIPTKNAAITKTLPISEIKIYVDNFINYAKMNPHIIFLVTEIGCGLAKLSYEEVAPLFEKSISLDNVYLPQSFWDILSIRY